MITNVIVYAACVLTGVFVLAWAVSPALRGWIERPKYQFLENVRRYDDAQ